MFNTWRYFVRRFAAGCLAAGATAWASAQCYAQIAFDSADDSVYANGWQQGDDGGIGSFGPWRFDGTYASSVQHRMDDGLKTGGASSSTFNNIGNSWTLFNPAPSDFARAGRSMGALQVGQTVRIVIDNPTARQPLRGYSVNFNTGGGNICAACPPGAILKYKIERLENDNNGRWSDASGPLGLSDTDTDGGARIDFKLSSATTYEMKMTPLDNPTAAITTTGALVNAATTTPIDWIEFQFFNTQTSPGLSTEFFIKSMQILAAPPGVPGDYNGNGTVDAADYVLWRKRTGQNFQLHNEVSGVTPGRVTAEDYTAWRTRFGSRASGAALSVQGVPEPAFFAHFAAGIVGLFLNCRMRRSGVF
jgi:hypothetical protein